AKEKAKRVGCLNNLKQMGLACMMYAQDNRGHLLGPSWIASERNNIAAGAYPNLTDRAGTDDDLNFLFPNYIKSLGSFVCPATLNSVKDIRLPNTAAPNGVFYLDD